MCVKKMSPMMRSSYLRMETFNKNFFIGETTIDYKGENTTIGRGNFQPLKLTNWKEYETHLDNISITIAKAK